MDNNFLHVLHSPSCIECTQEGLVHQKDDDCTTDHLHAVRGDNISSCPSFCCLLLASTGGCHHSSRLKSHRHPRDQNLTYDDSLGKCCLFTLHVAANGGQVHHDNFLSIKLSYSFRKPDCPIEGRYSEVWYDAQFNPSGMYLARSWSLTFDGYGSLGCGNVGQQYFILGRSIEPITSLHHIDTCWQPWPAAIAARSSSCLTGPRSTNVHDYQPTDVVASYSVGVHYSPVTLPQPAHL